MILSLNVPQTIFLKADLKRFSISLKKDCTLFSTNIFYSLQDFTVISVLSVFITNCTHTFNSRVADLVQFLPNPDPLKMGTDPGET